jgi:hypothetical protein
MAIHQDLRSMSIEAINEYLAISEYCTSTCKPNGGLYGYPSVLLLFCVIDAVSNHVGHAEHTFHELKSIFPRLSDEQVKKLKQWYRHLLAHQAIIMPGTVLSPDPDGEPIDFNSDGEPTHIRVVPLFRAVKGWWEAFDMSAINPNLRQKQPPKNPALASTTSSPLPSASGSYVTSTVKP